MQRLDIKRKLSARSDRVKSVDIHPTEPWVLASLYNGHVYLWNYSTQELVKSFEVTDLPVRAARFVARKQWLIAASDDMQLRVYNYNTMEKLKQFEAHSDYIRSLAVHPTQPFVLSSSDDMLIKLWDWEKGWQCTQVFEGHSHYVMMVTFNPKDTNTFASASLDRTVKVWGLGSNAAHFTLEGHEKGVNAVEYFLGGDKPYLLTGSDDATVKVWDYQHKSCVQTLEGHANNVSVVGFHAGLNLIVSGSEDGTLRLWHSNTYRLEKTLNYGLERVWALNLLKGSNKLAIGYDEGTVLLKLASEAPAVSMDAGGKIIWARQNEIQGAVLRLPGAAATDDGEGGAPAPAAPAPSAIADGERLSVTSKELGTCEFSPAYLAHSHNGRFVVVCGDGEYVIYTALAWRNKTFGSAVEFVWGTDTGEYAIREAAGKVKVFSNFKETRSFRPTFGLEGLFGGALLGVRSTSFVCFYDWRDDRMLRRIDVVPHGVFWSESGELVALACDTSFYLLRFARDKVNKAIESGAEMPEEGFEFAFEVLHEVNERVRTGHWVGDCFIYTNAQSRLNYCVGGEVATIAHLDRKLYLLGYLPNQSRLFLADKQLNVLSYALHLGVINYQTHVLRKDWAAADALLASIPVEQHNRIAAFLEAQGERARALDVATDPDLRLDLALQLGKLDVAHSLALEANSPVRWRQLGDLAIAAGKFSLAEECMAQSSDLNGLLLLHSSLGAGPALEQLAEMAREQGKTNVAFIALLLLQRIEQCATLLAEAGRVPEAAFFARTYHPSQVPSLVKLWRTDLASVNARAAEALADPLEYSNLFPDLAMALKVETVLNARRRSAALPASSYSQEKEALLQDLVAEFKRLPAEKLAELVAQAAGAARPTGASSSGHSGAPSGASNGVPTNAAPSSAPGSPALSSSLGPVVDSPAQSPAPKTPAIQAGPSTYAPTSAPTTASAPATPTSTPTPVVTASTPKSAAGAPPLPSNPSPAPSSPIAVAPAPTQGPAAPTTPATNSPAPSSPAAPKQASLLGDEEDDFAAFIEKADIKAVSPAPAGSPAAPASGTPAKPPAPATTFDDLLDWGDDK